MSKLKSLSSPENQPHQRCSEGLCDGSGYIYTETEDSFTSKTCICAKIKYRLRIFGERFAHITLGEIAPRNAAQGRLKAILEANPATPIFLSGDVRAGKTHFLAAMFGYWHSKTRKIKYFTDQSLKAELKEAELSNDHDWALNTVENNKYIFIDDVGKAVVSEFHRSALHSFFNEIYNRKHHVFITSNDPLAVLGAPEYWGYPVARRVEDSCELVEF